MIEPTKIGNKTLYNVRVLNMSVAKHYGLVKEYCEIVSKARKDLKHNPVIAIDEGIEKYVSWMRSIYGL